MNLMGRGAMVMAARWDDLVLNRQATDQGRVTKGKAKRDEEGEAILRLG